MAEKRKSTKSKSVRKSPAKRRKSPKIKLSSGKVYFLAFLICFICAALLTLAVFVNKPAGNPVQTEKKPEVSAPVKPSAPAVPKREEKTVSKPVEKPAAKPQSKPEVKAPEKSVKPPVSIPVKPSVPEASTVKPAAAKSSVRPVEPPAPSDPFNIPKAVNNAKVVIVIDDAGRSIENLKRYTSLPMPLTIAVLPKLANTKGCAYVVRSSGKELILHQPMQAQNLNINPGPGAIKADMSTWEIASVINENLAELGTGVKGLNNHEGSLITADNIKIGAVLDVCASNKIYFLDSRTTAQTQAPQAALERDMVIYEKSGPYIDNVISREEMKKQIIASLNWANKNGKAIVIGHVDKSVDILPDLLAEMYPWMVKAGYKFATPSTLK